MRLAAIHHSVGMFWGAMYLQCPSTTGTAAWPSGGPPFHCLRRARAVVAEVAVLYSIRCPSHVWLGVSHVWWGVV